MTRSGLARGSMKPKVSCATEAVLKGSVFHQRSTASPNSVWQFFPPSLKRCGRSCDDKGGMSESTESAFSLYQVRWYSREQGTLVEEMVVTLPHHTRGIGYSRRAVTYWVVPYLHRSCSYLIVFLSHNGTAPSCDIAPLHLCFVVVTLYPPASQTSDLLFDCVSKQAVWYFRWAEPPDEPSALKGPLGTIALKRAVVIGASLRRFASSCFPS